MKKILLLIGLLLVVPAVSGASNAFQANDIDVWQTFPDNVAIGETFRVATMIQVPNMVSGTLTPGTPTITDGCTQISFSSTPTTDNRHFSQILVLRLDNRSCSWSQEANFGTADRTAFGGGVWDEYDESQRLFEVGLFPALMLITVIVCRKSISNVGLAIMLAGILSLGITIIVQNEIPTPEVFVVGLIIAGILFATEKLFGERENE